MDVNRLVKARYVVLVVLLFLSTLLLGCRGDESTGIEDAHVTDVAVVSEPDTLTAVVATSQPSPTARPSDTATATIEPSATNTMKPTATDEPTHTPTLLPSATITPSPTPPPTNTFAPTPAPTSPPLPTLTPTPEAPSVSSNVPINYFDNNPDWDALVACAANFGPEISISPDEFHNVAGPYEFYENGVVHFAGTEEALTLNQDSAASIRYVTQGDPLFRYEQAFFGQLPWTAAAVMSALQPGDWISVGGQSGYLGVACNAYQP